ncbi:hypothetical protein C8R46DRAFT_1208170 [Mycena filopes]|nr:hypothetical protein C8R46DRAFT_1208170 [Mycena filopes]
MLLKTIPSISLAHTVLLLIRVSAILVTGVLALSPAQPTPHILNNLPRYARNFEQVINPPENYSEARRNPGVDICSLHTPAALGLRKIRGSSHLPAAILNLVTPTLPPTTAPLLPL